MTTPPRTLRIGTRKSPLAIWQARLVKQALADLGHKSVLVPITSAGDMSKNKPLYAFGMSGVFTKALDSALLGGDIDIAVHSLKDVPTELPQNIVQLAVLKRGNPQDTLVPKAGTSGHITIATGSLRRKAQWLDRYPRHRIVGLRGNIEARLQKLEAGNWDGAIIAAAALERLGLSDPVHISLDWMVPAPGQGAIMIAGLAGGVAAQTACAGLNDADTEICTTVERKFLNLLEAGCTAPIGAYAQIRSGDVHFKGILLSCDGREKIEVSRIVPRLNAHRIAQDCVKEIEGKGGRTLVAATAHHIKADLSTQIVSTKTLSLAQKSAFSEAVNITDYDFIDIQCKDISKDFLRCETVLFTSQNAVRALLVNYKTPDFQFDNILCVGARTRELIEKEIGKVSYKGANAQDLAVYIAEQTAIKSLRYFCGNMRLDDLSNILKTHHIDVEDIQAYETVYTPHHLQVSLDAVLFYSPSGVESFTQGNGSNIIAFCIGPTTAAAARKYFRRVVQAEQASIDSLIKRVNQHYA